MTKEDRDLYNYYKREEKEHASFGDKVKYRNLQVTLLIKYGL